MEKLISTKCNIQSVPESYLLPPERRPGNFSVPQCETIPVIDLGGETNTDRTTKIQQIMKASQEYGFFQLINRGVPEKLMRDALTIAKELFELPLGGKASLYSEDPKKSCRLYTSIDYVNEKVHFWRDNLRHPCHPVEEHRQFWPTKPAQHQEVIGNYLVEARTLSLWVLDKIREGLGLELGSFELSQVQLMTLNHYPPCLDPSLTLGLPQHSDVNLTTLLLQGDVNGLQVFKDGQWVGVEPIPHAFSVNIGRMLQTISNGMLRSAEHRVVTNTTTVASFIHPSNGSYIEPAKDVVNSCSPQLYKSFIYKDFLATYITDTHSGIPPIERYKL